MMRTAKVLWAYYQAKKLKFASRLDLENHQTKQLEKHTKFLIKNSAHFAQFAALPILQWPVMNKTIMLQHFDQMNTAQLKRDDVFKTALASEASRDFVPTINGVTVGLSSGTSGQRGVFAVSDNETARWAGIMLAKTLPDGLFAHERVAFFLRANSNLYQSIESRWLTFRYFDLFMPLREHITALNVYQPSILVAPAQVLRELALNKNLLNFQPKKVISVAELLDETDKKIIEEAFKSAGKVHQIYQATEGFLAYTCKLGTLHLNEEYVHIEPEWLDETRTRFTPIITDFTRRTQPIVRYKLNDILLTDNTLCACGNPSRTLLAIEGRQDDSLLLAGKNGDKITIFADMISRAIARHLPLEADYRLIQTTDNTLHLYASCREGKFSEENLQVLKTELNVALQKIGVEINQLQWQFFTHIPTLDATNKRRRIIRESGIA
jgi:putative adenylate-forming enzyme